MEIRSRKPSLHAAHVDRSAHKSSNHSVHLMAFLLYQPTEVSGMSNCNPSVTQTFSNPFVKYFFLDFFFHSVLSCENDAFVLKMMPVHAQYLVTEFSCTPDLKQAACPVINYYYCFKSLLILGPALQAMGFLLLNYPHGLLCLVLVTLFQKNWDSFTHTFQGYFTGTGASMPQCQ